MTISDQTSRRQKKDDARGRTSVASVGGRSSQAARVADTETWTCAFGADACSSQFQLRRRQAAPGDKNSCLTAIVGAVSAVLPLSRALRLLFLQDLQDLQGGKQRSNRCERRERAETGIRGRWCAPASAAPRLHGDVARVRWMDLLAVVIDSRGRSAPQGRSPQRTVQNPTFPFQGPSPAQNSINPKSRETKGGWASANTEPSSLAIRSHMRADVPTRTRLPRTASTSSLAGHHRSSGLHPRQSRRRRPLTGPPVASHHLRTRPASVIEPRPGSAASFSACTGLRKLPSLASPNMLG